MQDETIVDIHYCGTCLQILTDFGHPAVSTFEIIVETYIIFGVTYKHIPKIDCIFRGNLDFIEIKKIISARSEKILNFLESKGFINTCDVFDDFHVDIVPRGINLDGTKYLICIDPSHDFV